jgi:hypothetical protein
MTPPAPPVITQQPLSQTVAAGSPALFSVTASGVTSYTWRINGANLADGGRISGSTTPDLVIADTSTADSGSQISCVVSNSIGFAISSNALLTVYSAATPWFTSFAKLPNNQFQATLCGSPQNNYTIYFSTDLKTWKALTTVTPTNGSVTVVDPAIGLQKRFYRAMLVP